MNSAALERSSGQTRSRKVPVYQVLAEDLQHMGARVAFGLMSDDTALLATALDSLGVRFYGARHENCAIAMAEGYAYASGRLGVAVVGRGPALANGVHAAVYASRTGSPVLLIYGEAPTSYGPNALGPITRRLMELVCCGRPVCEPSRQQARSRHAWYSLTP